MAKKAYWVMIQSEPDSDLFRKVKLEKEPSGPAHAMRMLEKAKALGEYHVLRHEGSPSLTATPVTDTVVKGEWQ